MSDKSLLEDYRPAPAYRDEKKEVPLGPPDLGKCYYCGTVRPISEFCKCGKKGSLAEKFHCKDPPPGHERPEHGEPKTCHQMLVDCNMIKEALS